MTALRRSWQLLSAPRPEFSSQKIPGTSAALTQHFLCLSWPSAWWLVPCCVLASARVVQQLTGHHLTIAIWAAVPDVLLLVRQRVMDIGIANQPSSIEISFRDRSVRFFKLGFVAWSWHFIRNYFWNILSMLPMLAHGFIQCTFLHKSLLQPTQHMYTNQRTDALDEPCTFHCPL